MTAQMTTSTTDQAYWKSTKTPLDAIVRELQDLLSRRLTAVIAGVKDGKTVARWADGAVDGIRNDAIETRLRTAYRIALMLLETSDSHQTVKAWFIGLNPELGDVAPAEAIRNDRLQDAIAAARAFVASG